MDLVEARPERHVECKGAFNVRDLGGHRAADGRSLRWRTLFRADGLHRVPGTSETAIRELGWRTVIDLRSAAETDIGMYRCDGVEVVHLPVLSETWDRDALVDDGDHVGFLVDRNLEMLDEGAVAFATSVDILAARDRLPAVFHCSAGKDRTGVLAALVLSVLGVSDHQIAADYHLSALAMDQLVAWLLEHHPDLADSMSGAEGRAERDLTSGEAHDLRRSTDQPKHFLACPPEAMLTFLDRLRSRFGCAEGYLLEAGISSSTLATLREHLLED